MDELPGEIAALHARMQENWYQFFRAELRTCFNAVDFGDTELQLGQTEVAAKEIHAAEKGLDTILRFLPQMESQERRIEIEAALPRLRDAVDALRNKLGLSHETESGAA